jgi:hypothetical protein
MDIQIRFFLIGSRSENTTSVEEQNKPSAQKVEIRLWFSTDFSQSERLKGEAIISLILCYFPPGTCLNLRFHRQSLREECRYAVFNDLQS